MTKKTLINTIQLLRFPFSFFLLPISLFSFYYIRPEISFQFWIVVLVWHLLVFPSSNGYNSYNDRDDGPIGGLKEPPKPTRMLLHIANAFDAIAVMLSLSVNLYFAFFVTIYIIFSRLYSNRSIRLKKYPWAGFIVVFVLQGAWVFVANFFAFTSVDQLNDPRVVYSALAASFFIGTVYPLTQIYQHESDANDGVRTLSMLLGKRGTFVFSAIMFLLSTLCIFLAFNNDTSILNFWIFNLVMLPATLYFLIWTVRSFRETNQINFRNTMIMLVLSSVLNNLFFIILLIRS